MCKKVLENEQGKYGWSIKVYTENIFSDYYTSYYRAYGSDNVYKTIYDSNDHDQTTYIRRGE